MAKPEEYSFRQESPEPELLTVKDGRSLVLEGVVQKLIPFIQLFSLYVLAFGEVGAGGGFQGGVILGASVIVYILLYDLEKGKLRVSYTTIKDVLTSAGVFIYGGIGVLCLIAGGNYLQYGALPLGTPADAGHWGIFGIEVGVQITVAAVMMTLFCEIARRGE